MKRKNDEQYSMNDCLFLFYVDVNILNLKLIDEFKPTEENIIGFFGYKYFLVVLSK